MTRRILTVDDQKIARDHLKQILEAEGYEVEAAEDGVTALEMLREKTFHLVITDAPGEASWPITASVFILVPRQPRDAAATALALDFFRWAWRNGADQAKALDYVPLPPALVERIEAYLARRIGS